MSVEEFLNVCGALACPPYRFAADRLGDGWYLRVEFDTPTGRQHGRKWYVSRHSTESELVQTALKAVLTAAEHEIRETFRYRHRTVFAPHFDVNGLMELADAGRTELRAAVGSGG